MKKFLSILFAGALMAGLITTVSAQGGAKGGKAGATQGQRGPGGPGGGGGRRMMQDLMAKIKPPLTADQKKKLEALNTKFREEFRKLREAPGDMQSKRPKMEALMKKRQAEMNKILNKQQQESLKKLMEEAMKNRRGGPGGPGGPGGRAGGPPPPGGKAGGSRPPL